MKKISTILAGLVIALVFLSGGVAYADHSTNKSWVFHWENSETIKMTGTSGENVSFNRIGSNNGRFNFTGIVNYSAFDCPDQRGITFVVIENEYNADDPSKPTPIDTGNYGPPGDRTCDYSDALVDYLRSGDAVIGFTAQTDTGSFTGSNETETAEIKQSCEDIGVSLAWIACGVLKFADFVITWADNQIASLLSLPSAYYDNPDLRTSWARIRNLSYLILLPMMLVMVLGTALGFQAIDAYTVKRALPRLVAAVLFIALSYDIGVFAIQFTETLGRGIMGLIGSPFSIEIKGETVNAVDVTLQQLFNPGNEEGGLVFTFILVGFIGTLAVVSLGILASYALIFFVTLLVIFLLLAFRQMLLILLLVMAPLAILSWIFPANNKLWELWKGSFTKLLLLFPIVYLLVGAGRIFAVLVNQSGQHSGTGDSGLIGVILKLSAYILPYFFIPLVFKFAGGAFATIAGMAQDRERGLFDRQRKYRQRKMGENWRDFKAGDKKFRPQAFKDLGRRVGAGASGRFGFGETGRQAIALNAQHNADEALKNNARLQKLAFHDDGNAVMALGGESEASAREAARELFTDAAGNYDSVRAERAIAAAKAVGFSRSNARAALTTLAQNKSRSVAAGARGRRQIQNGINRLAGNAQEAHDLRDNFAFHSSGAGRGDLGATDWNTPNASLTGFERTGLYQAAGGHQNNIIGAREDAVALANSGVADDMQLAAVHLQELKAMRPNATGPARDEINESIEQLESSRALQDHMATIAPGDPDIETFDTERADPTHARYDPNYVPGVTPRGTTPATARPWTPAEMAQGFRTHQKTFGNLASEAARSYERPDPNRM